MAAVGALSRIGMMRGFRQYGGIVFLFFRGGLIADGFFYRSGVSQPVSMLVTAGLVRA